MNLLRLHRASILALSLTVVACGDDGGKDTEGETPDAEAPDGGTADGSSQDPITADGDLGKGDGSDVIAIGDSWMNLSGDPAGIQWTLKASSGQNYRTYGIPGTCLLPNNCFLPGVIPDQYARAKTENPDIKTVVMTAGGNDILQDFGVSPTCSDDNFDSMDPCKTRIDEIATRLTALWMEMSKDGVRDVIIVGYTRKAQLLFGGGTLVKVGDYTATKIPPLCEAVPAPLRCHVLDADEAVPDLALRPDNIHPDDPSYAKLGKAVFELMEEKGMRR